MANEKFTWADLKEIVNNMPEELLDKPVHAWYVDDEGGCTVDNCEVLGEDYHFDGDENCCPASIITKEEYYKESPEDYLVVHPKGTPILHIPKCSDNL